jgi:hypothetical protein
MLEEMFYDIMFDELASLRTCEDDFSPLPPVPTRTVVCKGIWGHSGFWNDLYPTMLDQKLVLSDMGLTHEGISLIFQSQQEAAMFRLFYSGDTEVA